MDPPLPPHPTTIARHQIEKMDESLAPIPGAKLRLMCSYGGHIIPRPHDKTLCYVGGETRIVVVDRKSSLSDVHARLSCNLLGGRKFTLKYQLPNEELDNLISVTTDEDMVNMIVEYDRLMSASALKTSRLRLFLFLAKPETAASMSALLDNGESWFIDSLNGADLLQRGVSDSAAIHNLIEFDGMVKGNQCSNIEAQPDDALGNKQMIRGVDQEVHIAMPDSPMVETSSSFDSNISSPSMVNIPQIDIKIEDTDTRLQEHLSGLGKQLLHINVASDARPSFHPDHGCITTIPSTVGENSSVALLDNLGRIIYDDERSDNAVSVRLRRPLMPLQPVKRMFTDPYSLPSPNSKNARDYNLQSPDSVASDGSLRSPASHSKQTVYLDPPSPAYEENILFAARNDSKNNIINSSPQMQMQMQQAHDPVMLASSNVQQQQYIQHMAPSFMPISSYYPTYAATKQQQFHQQFDQHYPVYLMPVNHSQPDTTSVPSSPSNPVSASYTELNPPVYTAKTTTTTSPETLTDSPKTVPAPTSPYIHVPPNQFQQQYYGVPQGQPPPQFIPSASSTTTKFIPNYGHAQLKYVQYLPPQYQPMTPATTSVLISHASTQQSQDNDAHQIKTSQPL